MINIKIEVDFSDLDFDVNKIEKAISEELETTAYKCERVAKEVVPVDTGSLRNSISVDKVSPLYFIVSPNMEYMYYIEFGTAPHIIRGNPWLRLEDGTYRREIFHPGNKPYLYMEAGFGMTEGLEDRVANAIERVI